MAENEAHAFCREVCLGNTEAMQCCDLFYKYVHGIDDIIDTKEDSRPTMSNEKIIETFITCAGLYNCSFYRNHANVLLGVIIVVTNTWADSVAWERSPLEHRRTMSNVLRTCGDDFFFAVAMICGGWQHLRNVSAKIREADYLRQNDDEHLKSEGI
jgi:hypothetical protein